MSVLRRVARNTVGLLIITVALRTGSASGVSIGLFSVADCSSCNLEIPSGEARVFYIAASSAGLSSGEGIVSAEFRVTGVPADWSYSILANPEAIAHSGDPLGTGAEIGFASPQVEACINLYTVVLVAGTSVRDARFRVTSRIPPTLLPCPHVVIGCTIGPCDTAFCVGEGELFINSETNCTVGVKGASWAAVKQLYRDATK